MVQVSVDALIDMAIAGEGVVSFPTDTVPALATRPDRAELIFRAQLDPYAPASTLSEETAAALWRDWSSLLADGVKTGVMVTRNDLDAPAKKKALTNPSLRHFVYKRQGKPCLRCGSPVAMDIMQARKLYFCPTCQSQ